MKRFIFVLSIASIILLAACQVTVSVASLRITEPAAAITDATPGQQISFKATVTTGVAISWSDGGAGGSFNPETGAETVYTAPSADGTYTVTASAGALSDTVSVTVIDPLPVNITLTVEGNGSVPNPLSSGEVVLANSSRVYQLNIPNADKALLGVELSENLRLSVYDSAKNLFASSASASFFAAGEAGLATAISSQAILDNAKCFGSCVLQNAAGVTTVFAKVENTGTGPVTFDLFVYAVDFRDSGEPANDSQAGAVSLTESDRGAIELIGDIDFYNVATTASLVLNAVTNVIEIRAQVLDAQGMLVGTLSVNDSIAVSPGMTIKVFSENNRAATPSAGSYTLELIQ